MSRSALRTIVWVSALLLRAAATPAWVGAGEAHHAANVPPTQEIEVLDPNADPLGNPAVELRTKPCGQMQVDIPQTILVHKLYYSGDRSFQAQMLPGGPAIVVVNHPKTGERCYVNVQMFPGAPRVTYTAHAIEYDFGDRGVAIHFGLFGPPKVVYRNGRTWGQCVGGAAVAVGHEICEVVDATGLPEHVHDACEGTKNAVKAAAMGVKQASKIVTTPVEQIVSRTPLGSIFHSNPEQDAEDVRDRELQSVEKERFAAEATIRTIR
jgi:hypothetical protein